MDAEEIRRRVRELNVWKQGDERAPHKPLLLLMELARIQRGDSSRVSFREIEKPLKQLLIDFGPQRQSYHPELPFWHLQSDGLWKVEAEGELLKRGETKSPRKTELIEKKASGEFPSEVEQTLRNNPALVQELSLSLLRGHFPESLHEPILEAVGLNLATPTSRIPRDPSFRREVIRAYEHRCAVCGYDVKLGGGDLGLEAAHIRWHQAQGPDVVQNGLALCSIHHLALDRGAIGLSEERTILVSADVHGSTGVEELLVAFTGKPLRKPSAAHLRPEIDHIRWHTHEVFRGPAR